MNAVMKVRVPVPTTFNGEVLAVTFHGFVRVGKTLREEVRGETASWYWIWEAKPGVYPVYSRQLPCSWGSSIKPEKMLYAPAVCVESFTESRLFQSSAAHVNQDQGCIDSGRAFRIPRGVRIYATADEAR